MNRKGENQLGGGGVENKMGLVLGRPVTDVCDPQTKMQGGGLGNWNGINEKY